MQNQRMSIKLEHIKHQLSNKFRNTYFFFLFPNNYKKHNIINNYNHGFVREA